MGKFEFQNLVVYQKAKSFHYQSLNCLKNENVTTYHKDQLSRASFSIVLNIAEGSGRFTNADRKNFFIIARSSLFECISILDILCDAKFISLERKTELEEMGDELSRILFAMIKNLSK
ncbi:MAG: four helix bundle protein [Crocinitomicaceae bacterium]|jgi:four helix bundle protein|nr:four helix bundle protein [Crocinitomicaceae bacterium]